MTIRNEVEPTSVTMLLTASGEVCSVWASREDAEAIRSKYNSDPYLEPGVPDHDAPYRLVTWGVQAGHDRPTLGAGGAKSTIFPSEA